MELEDNTSRKRKNENDNKLPVPAKVFVCCMNANCAKYWFSVYRFCAEVLVLVLGLPLLSFDKTFVFGLCAKISLLVTGGCSVLGLSPLSLFLCQSPGAWFIIKLIAFDCACLSKVPVLVIDMVY